MKVTEQRLRTLPSVSGAVVSPVLLLLLVCGSLRAAAGEYYNPGQVSFNGAAVAMMWLCFDAILYCDYVRNRDQIGNRLFVHNVCIKQLHFMDQAAPRRRRRRRRSLRVWRNWEISDCTIMLAGYIMLCEWSGRGAMVVSCAAVVAVAAVWKEMWKCTLVWRREGEEEVYSGCVAATRITRERSWTTFRCVRFMSYVYTHNQPVNQGWAFCAVIIITLEW